MQNQYTVDQNTVKYKLDQDFKCYRDGNWCMFFVCFGYPHKLTYKCYMIYKGTHPRYLENKYTLTIRFEMIQLYIIH